MQQTSFQGWIASLSNGEQRFQGPEVNDEPTPWKKFQMELAEKPELEVTGLRLVIGTQTFNALPQKQCDGYVQAMLVTKPFFRSMGQNGEKERYWQGIGSVVDDKVYILWVDLQNGNVKQEVSDLSSYIVHSTIREANNVRPDNERGSG